VSLLPSGYLRRQSSEQAVFPQTVGEKVRTEELASSRLYTAPRAFRHTTHTRDLAPLKVSGAEPEHGVTLVAGCAPHCVLLALRKTPRGWVMLRLLALVLLHLVGPATSIPPAPPAQSHADHPMHVIMPPPPVVDGHRAAAESAESPRLARTAAAAAVDASGDPAAAAAVTTLHDCLQHMVAEHAAISGAAHWAHLSGVVLPDPTSPTQWCTPALVEAGLEAGCTQDQVRKVCTDTDTAAAGGSGSGNGSGSGDDSDDESGGQMALSSRR
jgi:hypothetical protein